jgi:hypothetical protein
MSSLKHPSDQRSAGRASLAAVASGLLLAVTAQATHAQALSAQSALYSGQVVRDYCIEAQKVTANTPLTATAVNHSSLAGFTPSSSAPYEGPNLSAYNAKGPTGNALPLTVQSWVNYATIPATGWQFPQIVSCKMKDAESIRFHLGQNNAGAQQDCRSVNQGTVARVYQTLTSAERRLVRYPQTSVVFDEDSITLAGPSWLGGLPNIRPALIYLGNDGLLHIRSNQNAVERTNPSDAAGPDKKGSFYCHFPAPEYVRSVVLGQYPACTAASLPVICFLP